MLMKARGAVESSTKGGNTVSTVETTHELSAQEVLFFEEIGYLGPYAICTPEEMDAATTENSCVQIIPSSHKKEFQHIRSTEGMGFSEMADPSHFDASRAIDMVLKPGEFFLFNEKTMHHSNPNRSQKRRLGLAIRVTVPKVKVDHSKMFEEHKVILLRGEDRHQLNESMQPLPAC